MADRELSQRDPCPQQPQACPAQAQHCACAVPPRLGPGTIQSLSVQVCKCLSVSLAGRDGRGWQEIWENGRMEGEVAVREVKEWKCLLAGEQPDWKPGTKGYSKCPARDTHTWLL